MNLETNKQNISTQCKYFVIRKKRFCRMTVKSGFEYCGEHEPKLQDSMDLSPDSRQRIPCPLDSKHTCFANKLAKHLKKCNAQKDPQVPYVSKNINCEKNDDCIQNTRQLSKVGTNTILAVIQKVNKLHEDIINSVVRKKILHNEILSNEINKPEYGNTTKKHLLQTSSLIEHLNVAKLLDTNTCFIEFGAGKGQLSYWLTQLIQPLQDSSVLLVERASLRHKLDNKLDKSINKVHRIRADIADLILSEIEIIKKTSKVVGVTKHLCGEATDLALRCLTNGIKRGVNVQGLVMAFCCHHRCYWKNYTGKKFFIDNHLSEEEFDIICGLVSWATCGSGLSREARKKLENNQELPVSRDEEIPLTRTEKEMVGKKCKLLIDYGRVHYLQDHNFSCNLYNYVEEIVTLENVCVVAKKI